MHRPLILVCDIKTSLSVRLSVTRSTIEADVWIWTHIISSGEVIATGKKETILAAQVAAQHAHESWQYRNRSQLGFTTHSYSWKEVE
jgi:hypothetical protein